MDFDLNISPPDSEVFKKTEKSVKPKRQMTDAQKEALAKAREKAKQNNLKKKQIEEPVEEEVESEAESESVPEPPPVKKQVAKRKAPVKRVVKSEEEIKKEEFEKFMSNMSAFEKYKQDKIEEDKEKQRVKISFEPDEYAELLQILEKNEKDKEMLKHSPVAASKKEEQPPPSIKMLNLNKQTRPRFGR